MYGIRRSVGGLALIGPVAVSCVTLCVSLPTLPIRPGIALGIGGLTYPLYLLHENIGYAAFTRFGTGHGRWLVGAGVIAALFFASWLIATFSEPDRKNTRLNFSH